MCLTSYRGISGPWYSPVRNCVGVTSAQYQQLAANALGVIYHGSADGHQGGITDGTSNTMLMSEYVFSRLNIRPTRTAGTGGARATPTRSAPRCTPRTSRSAAPFGSTGDPMLYDNSASLAVISAVEQPPGRCEPPVRRRVGQVPQGLDPVVAAGRDNPQVPGWPTWRERHQHVHGPGRQHLRHLRLFVGNMPVYQALSTRAGGEVISADSY